MGNDKLSILRLNLPLGNPDIGPVTSGHKEVPRHNHKRLFRCQVGFDDKTVINGRKKSPYIKEIRRVLILILYLHPNSVVQGLQWSIVGYSGVKDSQKKLTKNIVCICTSFPFFRYGKHHDQDLCPTYLYVCQRVVTSHPSLRNRFLR